MKKAVWIGILICAVAGGALMGVGFGAEGTAATRNGATTAAATTPPAATVAAMTATGPATVRKKTDQMRGFSMRLVDPSPKAVASYLAGIDELADMGCTWVNFPITAFQETARSETLMLGKNDCPAEADVLKIMGRAKARGMGIMMMPTVLLRQPGSKDWRGVINPPNWDTWFESYRKFITLAARIAQRGDVDIFVVGSELLSTEQDRERWLTTIDQIKKAYKGKLTYSANWDHFGSVTFWDQLDYVGMNNYYELSKEATGKHANGSDVTVEELTKAWGPIRDNILRFAARQNKPFMFTEVGWHNLENTLKEPWNYVATGKIDLEVQERAFESFVETWKNVPNEQFMGAFIWEWYPEGKVVDGNYSRGTYSLQATPALEVVKKWFAMP
jgi:hypothetical protein